MSVKKNIFWSYREKPENPDLIIEHTLRYEDIDEIKSLISKYGLERCKEVWQKRLIPDQRLVKLNYFLAKFIFKVAESDEAVKLYLQSHNYNRLDRLNELFNR